MIPKIIHYCWFGGNPLPDLAVKCIESWKQFFPDYEIKEWNESNFDVNMVPYTAEAYTAKKFAFVSDYARFWILYQYGGIYFDTDVEVIKSMDDILDEGPFMGYEHDLTTHYLNGAINPGLGFACEPHMSIVKTLLERYNRLHFCVNGNLNLKTIVAYTTEIFLDNGLEIKDGIQQCCGFTIYPPDYFNPLNDKIHMIEKTENTRLIHHYIASWGSKSWIKLIYRFLKYRMLLPVLPKMLVEKIVKNNKVKTDKKINSRFIDNE